MQTNFVDSEDRKWPGPEESENGAERRDLKTPESTVKGNEGGLDPPLDTAAFLAFRFFYVVLYKSV